MPFGLKNTPAIFQQMMNSVFNEKLNWDIVIYIDDTGIATEDVSKNVEVTRWVLQKMRDNRLFACPEKCKFLMSEMEWLGLWIMENGMEMDKHKIEAITNWPAPKNVKDIQTFLGFANFYQRFIKDFSRIVGPITNLLWKDVEFYWSKDCQESFDKLKNLFTSSPILIHHNPNKPSHVETDASGFAYGAILLQKAEDNKLHPVAFMSKSMTPAERNYNIYDKEMLPIVQAFKSWRHYLQGGKFPVRILTDHNNLKYFKKSQKLNPCQF